MTKLRIRQIRQKKVYELNKLNVSHDTKHDSKQSLFKYSEEEELKKWKARKLLRDFN